MTDRSWLAHYPPGVAADIDPAAFPSLGRMLEDSFARYADRVAYSCMGRDMTYAQTDQLSRALGAYLQSLGLVPGDRVALMMPNCLQYPIAVAAILRAGYVVVNVNPLYTPRELGLQLKDAGVKTIVIMENFAHTLQKCMAQTQVKHVIVCAMGDRLGWLKGALVNYVIRHRRKLVPAYDLPAAVGFNEALERGARSPWQPVETGPADLALLQYTGGTTGTSKGAMLLHRNLVANVLQSEMFNQPVLARLGPDEPFVMACVLPLYHIFAFTIGLLMTLRLGGRLILVPNPRDLDAVLHDLKPYAVHCFPSVNTMFKALALHPKFHCVDWSQLKLSLGGGAAVQSAVAALWLEKTGCPILEGYGLSETSPSACCNPLGNTTFSGTIGIPVPSTEMRILDEQGQEVPVGEVGEIAIRGPQVMAGYWQRADETARVMTADGFFRTGDLGMRDARGYFSIVDRKKDMILVSGFNVYPSEIEEVLSHLPRVQECAAVGVPDERTGEAVKLVIVKRDAGLTEADVRAYCEENLTHYKLPKFIEFRKELPKTPVGKILRRELRAAA